MVVPMQQARVIPVLLLKGQGLVKTVRFGAPQYVGDPINAVRIFNEKEVDELVLLDITATRENREPDYERIRDLAGESFMPLGYGGGIKTLEQIKTVFKQGVEKVIINSAGTDDGLIRSAVAIYGSQSIVGSVDVKRTLFGRYDVYIRSGTEKLRINLETHVRNLVAAGVGEIVIQSIDREGTMKGLDLELVQTVSQMVDIPVVATGGVGSLDHVREGIVSGHASAVAAGSLFVYKGKHRAVLINYPDQEKLKGLFND